MRCQISATGSVEQHRAHSSKPRVAVVEHEVLPSKLQVRFLRIPSSALGIPSSELVVSRQPLRSPSPSLGNSRMSRRRVKVAPGGLKDEGLGYRDQASPPRRLVSASPGCGWDGAQCSSAVGKSRTRVSAVVSSFSLKEVSAGFCGHWAARHSPKPRTPSRQWTFHPEPVLIRALSRFPKNHGLYDLHTSGW